MSSVNVKYRIDNNASAMTLILKSAIYNKSFLIYHR